MVGHEYFIGIEINNQKVIYDLSKIPEYSKIEGEHRLEILDKFLSAFKNENALKSFLNENGIPTTYDEIFIYEKEGDKFKKVSKPIYRNASFLLNDQKIKELSKFLFINEPAYVRLLLEFIKNIENYEPYRKVPVGYYDARKALIEYQIYMENKDEKGREIKGKYIDSKFPQYGRTVKDYGIAKSRAKKGLPILYEYILTKKNVDAKSYRFLHDFVDFVLEAINTIEYLRYSAEQYIEINDRKFYATHGYKKEKFLGKIKDFENYETFLTVISRLALEELDLKVDASEYKGKYINLNRIFNILDDLEDDYGETLDEYTNRYNEEHDTYYDPKDLEDLYKTDYDTPKR